MDNDGGADYRRIDEDLELLKRKARFWRQYGFVQLADDLEILIAEVALLREKLREAQARKSMLR